MDMLMSELLKLLVPVVASAALAGLRRAAPALKDKVPGLLWPFAIFGIARLGAAACSYADVACNASNPFDWSPETVSAMAASFIAIVVHRVAKDVKSGELVAKLKGLLDKVSGSGNAAK